jgi:hypothetical protein
MCRVRGKLLLIVALVVGLLALPNASRSASGQDKKDKTDPPKVKIDPQKVEAQKKAVELYWKEAFEGESKPPLVETAHFLMVGVAKPGSDLTASGNLLEQQYTKACKLLELKPDPAPWGGKLTVYLVPDVKKYGQFIRTVERRKVEEDEVACRQIEGDYPYIAACTNKIPGDLGVLNNVGAQLGMLVLEVRLKTTPPAWLNEGFGRATVLHYCGPATALTAERRKASVILTKSNRGLAEVFGNTLKAEEQPYLRSSFIDYLAFSNRTAKFLPLIDSFRPDPKGNPGTLEMALKNVKTTVDELNGHWQTYAKSFK